MRRCFLPEYRRRSRSKVELSCQSELGGIGYVTAHHHAHEKCECIVLEASDEPRPLPEDERNYEETHRLRYGKCTCTPDGRPIRLLQRNFQTPTVFSIAVILTRERSYSADCACCFTSELGRILMQTFVRNVLESDNMQANVASANHKRNARYGSKA